MDVRKPPRWGQSKPRKRLRGENYSFKFRGSGSCADPRGGEIQQELIRFLTCPQRWRDAPGTALRPEGDRRTSKYTRCAWRRSRGGPIAEETTGDRKEKKIGDHKEDLRQKPHDRRRQSTYLHAVPERRCPSVAGSWCYSGEKFTNGLGESDLAAVRWQGGCRCLHAALPPMWRWMKRVLVSSTCHYVASCLPRLRPDWIFKYQKGRSEPQKSHPAPSPPPQHAHFMCSCCSASVCACVRARARLPLQNRRDDTVEPVFSTRTWGQLLVLGLCSWRTCPRVTREEKVHKQQRHPLDSLRTDSDLDPCAVCSHARRNQRTTTVTWGV